MTFEAIQRRCTEPQTRVAIKFVPDINNTFAEKNVVLNQFLLGSCLTSTNDLCASYRMKIRKRYQTLDENTRSNLTEDKPFTIL